MDPTLQSRAPAGPQLRRASGAGVEPESQPDLLLIERARAGDERATEALLRRYARRLFRVAQSVLLDGPRAEAAVLEAYLAAFGDLSRYPPTGKFAAWLTGLAFEQARALRSDARPAAAGLPPGEMTAQAVASPTAHPEEWRQLEQTIYGLPEVFRTVYVLRVIEGISGIETAASLGLHETTVRTRLFRAHRRLGAETAARVRAAAGLFELTPPRAERIVAGALARLNHGSTLTISASSP